MPVDEILAVVFGALLLGAVVVLSVWLLIEGYHDAKEHRAKEEEEKSKLRSRVDKLEYYINVLWWERENKDKKN